MLEDIVLPELHFVKINQNHAIYLYILLFLSILLSILLSLLILLLLFLLLLLLFTDQAPMQQIRTSLLPTWQGARAERSLCPVTLQVSLHKLGGQEQCHTHTAIKHVQGRG